MITSGLKAATIRLVAKLNGMRERSTYKTDIINSPFIAIHWCCGLPLLVSPIEFNLSAYLDVLRLRETDK
jgi:hypothetical protein